MQTVLIGGGSGLIGMRLSRLLKQKGFEVIHLSRKANLNAEFPRYEWNVAAGTIDEDAIQKADYVINLAGTGIAGWLWTKSRKKQIIESRVKSMLLLKNAFVKTGKTPKAFIAASASGFYGDRGEEWLDENASPGQGFLSESTQAWENSIKELESLNTRLVVIRIGIVLSLKGGALPKLALSQKFFIGTYFSNGKAYYPWIHIDDLCNIFIKSINDTQMKGTFNGVAPNPVTNFQLTKAIAQANNKKVIMIPVPAFLLRLVLGEMADTVLTSARVTSQKIINSGFKFEFPDLIPALKDLFTRDI